MCRSMHPRGVDLHQRTRQEVGLLLVVAFEADAVERLDDRVEQVDGAGMRQQLAAQVGGQRLEGA